MRSKVVSEEWIQLSDLQPINWSHKDRGLFPNSVSTGIKNSNISKQRTRQRIIHQSQEQLTFKCVSECRVWRNVSFFKYLYYLDHVSTQVTLGHSLYARDHSLSLAWLLRRSCLIPHWQLQEQPRSWSRPSEIGHRGSAVTTNCYDKHSDPSYTFRMM